MRHAMRMPRLHSALTLALASFTLAGLVLTMSACQREERRFREAAPGATPQGTARLSVLQPGEPRPMARHIASGYDENAYAITEGQRLFAWYNCAGCHANGGGGMGPPLIDDKWIYGSAPENIYQTIVEGRPNGMPAWGGRIPSSQIWQITAYVRSLSGLTPYTANSSRPDHMMYQPGSNALPKPVPTEPKQSYIPPASEMP